MGWQDAPLSPDATQAAPGVAAMPGPQSPAWMSAPETAPDQYTAAAQNKIAKLKAAGVNPDYGPAESFINGRMLGALPTVMAGLTTPFSMIEHGTLDPREGYNYAKAQQNVEKSDFDSAHPLVSGAADLAGGGMTGAGLAKAGVTATGALGSIGGGIVDGAGLGATSSALSGEGDDRLTGALQGGLIGGALGGAIPAALTLGKSLAAPAVNNIAARIWPEDSAQATLARAIMSSGKTPQELQLAIDNATAAGQPNYTLADALGKSGGDTLSNIGRSPGEAGQQVSEFLDARQASQGRDVANQLQTGLGIPPGQTALQLATALKAQRGADAATNYGAARANAGAVNVMPAVQGIDANLTPGVNNIVSPMSDLDGLPIDGKLQWIRDRLATDTNQLTDFQRTFGVKRQIDSMIGTATTKGDGATVATLKPIRDALDNQLAEASGPYANARDVYRQQSGAMDAIPLGEAAAKSGRPEDTIPAYNALPSDAQASYRTGYADPILENASNGNPMANKALPLANEGTRAELANMSQYQGPLQPGAKDQLAQALDRSNQMNSTYNRVQSGSKTFNNLAEGHQAGVDPGILFEAARGNFHGMAVDALRHATNMFSGSTPETRQYLAQMLLARGQGADVAGMAAPKIQSIQARQRLGQALLGASLGAGGNFTANQRISAP